ncbi:MAG TPA: transposase [Candidatus Omnitrophica bacterium]|nr:transposase [Candidatus Omnitrophota bacterium]
MGKRGRYPKEFKIEAVRLLSLGDKPASELALELGIKRALLYRWRDQVVQNGEAAFSGSGRPKNDQLSEVARLKKENAILREERDILKKAAAYFARDLK